MSAPFSAGDIHDLKRLNDELTAALARCRDLVPTPLPGHPLESAWLAAMADPTAVSNLLDEYLGNSALVKKYRIKVKGGDWHLSDELPAAADMEAIEAIEENRPRKPVAVEAITQALYRAAIDCPHEIDRQSVVLEYTAKQPGHNALNQLGLRLTAAFNKLVAPGDADTIVPAQRPVTERQIIAVAQAIHRVITRGADWEKLDAQSHGLWRDAARQAVDAALHAPQAPREPLTEEQKLAMWHAEHGAHRSWGAYEWYCHGIEAAEHAHGIDSAPDLHVETERPRG